MAGLAVAERAGILRRLWIKMADPAGAGTFTSCGCEPIPVACPCSMSAAGDQCEPDIARSSPLPAVNADKHHLTARTCQRRLLV
jgi:hypothetical protein